MVDNIIKDKLLKTSEVAKICFVTVGTVKSWIYKGKLKATKTMGGHHRVWMKDLKDFVDNNPSGRKTFRQFMRL